MELALRIATGLLIAFAIGLVLLAAEVRFALGWKPARSVDDAVLARPELVAEVEIFCLTHSNE